MKLIVFLCLMYLATCEYSLMELLGDRIYRWQQDRRSNKEQKELERFVNANKKTIEPKIQELLTLSIAKNVKNHRLPASASADGYTTTYKYHSVDSVWHMPGKPISVAYEGHIYDKAHNLNCSVTGLGVLFSSGVSKKIIPEESNVKVNECYTPKDTKGTSFFHDGTIILQTNETANYKVSVFDQVFNKTRINEAMAAVKLAAYNNTVGQFDKDEVIFQVNLLDEVFSNDLIRTRFELKGRKPTGVNVTRLYMEAMVEPTNLKILYAYTQRPEHSYERMDIDAKSKAEQLQDRKEADKFFTTYKA